MTTAPIVALQMAARRERARYLGALLRRLLSAPFTSTKAKAHAARTHCAA